MRRLPILVPALLAVSALAVAGCGSSSSDKSTSSAAPATSTPSSSGGGTVSVEMKNIQFVPQSITAKVGQKIVWTNNDSVAHTVTAKNGGQPKSDVIDPGQTYTFTP